MPHKLVFSFLKKKKKEAQVEIIFMVINIFSYFQFTLNLQPINCNLILNTKSTEFNQLDWIQ